MIARLFQSALNVVKRLVVPGAVNEQLTLEDDDMTKKAKRKAKQKAPSRAKLRAPRKKMKPLHVQGFGAHENTELDPVTGMVVAKHGEQV